MHILTTFGFRQRNFIKLKDKYTSFIDLGEQKQYQVVNANNGTFDILDVNEKEYANVRKEENLYKVIDYKQGKTFDFELIKMEN